MKMKTTLFFVNVILFGFVLPSKAQTSPFTGDNTFLGEYAGAANTGNFNSGFGKNALVQNTGNSNVGVGVGALSVSSGGFNCAFGNGSMAVNGAGTLNSAFGTRTLLNNNTGSRNIAFGHRTLEANVAGNDNTAIGYSALLFNFGSENIALGSYTPRNLQTGDANIFVGTETAINLLHGSNNVFLGNRIILDRAPSTPYLAGNDTNKSVIIADGSGNQRIFVSKGGAVGLGLGNNIIPVNRLDVKGSMAVGKNYTPNGLTAPILAPTNGLIVEGRVGIGTPAPGNKLEVASGTTGSSGLRFTNLNSTFANVTVQPGNKFLSVNATGDVVLQKVSNAVESNLLTSNVNLMTSNVNGIISSANIVNSISNSINTNNQLITTVNGVRSNPITLPQSLIEEVDGSISNELQTISQAGNTITLSNGGGSFVLPTFADTDGQGLSLAGNVLSISNGNSVTLPTQTLTQAGNTVSLSNGGGSFVLPTFADTDGQGLSLAGNVLSISNGNSVTLPTYTQTLTQAGNTVSLSNGGGSFTLPSFTDTDGQGLSLAGNVLSISNGNSVTLPTYTQTLSQAGNTVTLSNGGGSFTLPTFTQVPQTISQTGNTVTLSNGGGTFTMPSTSIVAGTNVTVTGNGSAATPFQISSTDKSIYADNGTINQATTINSNRIVYMNNSNIWFNGSSSESNGKIYIGATASYPNVTGNYKLFVEGGIMTEKVKVALRSTANWADYVFADNYDLMPLKNVEEFIAKNKHLPGIDSADELTKKGLDVAEMQSKHMAKIEELTLYIIDQNKAIEKNNKDIEELKKQIQLLTANKD
jgi:hypothetical protein